MGAVECWCGFWGFWGLEGESGAGADVPVVDGGVEAVLLEFPESVVLGFDVEGAVNEGACFGDDEGAVEVKDVAEGVEIRFVVEDAEFEVGDGGHGHAKA